MDYLNLKLSSITGYAKESPSGTQVKSSTPLTISVSPTANSRGWNPESIQKLLDQGSQQSSTRNIQGLQARTVGRSSRVFNSVLRMARSSSYNSVAANHANHLL